MEIANLLKHIFASLVVSYKLVVNEMCNYDVN
jgi:hypothetical protein